MKRGQLSLYTILGLIVIVLIAGISILISRSNQQTDVHEELAIPEYLLDLTNHIQSCLDSTASSAIIKVSSQSGFYNPSSINSISYDNYLIPISFFQGVINFPTEEQLQQSLSSYVEDNIKKCIQQKTFPGLKIGSSSPQVTSQLEEFNTKFSMRLPMHVSSAYASTELNPPYETNIPANLLYLYLAASSILEKLNEDPENLDLLYPLSLELDAELVSKDNTLIISLTDNLSKINKKPLTFTFAISR